MSAVLSLGSDLISRNYAEHKSALHQTDMRVKTIKISIFNRTYWTHSQPGHIIIHPSYTNLLPFISLITYPIFSDSEYLLNQYYPFMITYPIMKILKRMKSSKQNYKIRKSVAQDSGPREDVRRRSNITYPILLKYYYLSNIIKVYLLIQYY